MLLLKIEGEEIKKQILAKSEELNDAKTAIQLLDNYTQSVIGGQENEENKLMVYHLFDEALVIRHLTNTSEACQFEQELERRGWALKQIQATIEEMEQAKNNKSSCRLL